MKKMREDIKRIERGQMQWPKRLDAHKGMPSVLYYRGNLPADDRKTAAIVGARMCSQYGKRQAFQFAEILAAAGVIIISGMARGVDSCAHSGALAAGGETYAVLGSGVDICYPSSSREIYERIPENGGILSEFEPGSRPLPGHFPMRNRIISALADFVLVIEAKEQSGSLITADFALEQGKDVYAVPGRVGDALSAGCNRLIAQGAGIACSTQQLLEERNLEECSASRNLENPKIGLERDLDLVYSCVDLKPKDLHTILEEVSLPVEKTMELLLKLQMEGKILEVFRNCYVKV